MQGITARLVTAVSTEDVARALTESIGDPDISRRPNGRIDWCQVWLLAGDRIELVSASSGAPTPTATSQPLSGRSTLAERVRAKEASYSVCAHPDLTERHMLGIVPVILAGECLGLLVVAYPETQPIDADEQEFLTAMADQAAHALDRAKLYSEQASLAKASAFLAEAAQILAEAADFADTLDRLAGLALSVLGDICLIDVIGEDGVPTRMAARHRNPALQPLVDRLRADYPPDAAGSHPALEVINSGRTSWSADMTPDFLRKTTRDEQHLAIVQALGFRSYLAVPLLTGGEVVGAVTLVSASGPFDSGDVSFAERLAQQVAAVVNNAKLYDATLRTSHILQRSLLPRRLPTVPGLGVDTRYLPATRGLEVGGDFYDMVVLPSARVGFMIGDVAGHNRDAAAAMGQLRSAARALSGQVRSPAALIDALQWSWDLLGFDRISTAIFGRLDQSNGDLVMASAGHHPPLLIEAGSAHFLPVPPSPPLGAPSSRASNWEGRLERGQVLLLYTDGVLDERSLDGSGGMEQLARVAAGGDPQPQSVCERVARMLPSRRSDDVTLMALRLDD